MRHPKKRTKTTRIIDWLCGIIFLLILIGVGIGFYYRLHEKIALGDKYIGLSVLGFVFVLMPIFLVHRWRGKRLQDYTLTKENIERMRGENKMD